MQCPLCRADFTDVLPLPSMLKDTRAWYAACLPRASLYLYRTVDRSRVCTPSAARGLTAEHVPVRFDAVDADGNGKLDKREVLEALKAQLPCDFRSLELCMDSLWEQWDPNHDGFIEVCVLITRSSSLTSPNVTPPPILTAVPRAVQDSRGAGGLRECQLSPGAGAHCLLPRHPRG